MSRARNAAEIAAILLVLGGLYVAAVVVARRPHGRMATTQ